MSNNNNNSSSSGGIGFFSLLGLLGLLFIGLKLGKVITWSWLWVLSPFWIGLVLAAIVIILVIIANK